MNYDTDNLKAGYDKLVAEFGDKGAAVVAGVPFKFVDEALSSGNTYTRKLENFFKSRDEAYKFYSTEQCGLFLKLEHFIAESGSAGNVAKSLGMSYSTVSDIRNCKYRGDVEKFFSDISSFFNLKQEQKVKIYKGTDYVPTSVSEYIFQVIRGVHIAGECEIITGDTGVGKSRTISKYVSDYPENTVVVTPTYADSSVVGIMKLIAAQLGISGLTRLYDLNAAVI